jgi:type IV secretory pathway VirD2 relaxase
VTIIEEEFARALSSKVRHKSNNTRHLRSHEPLRSKARRVAMGAPEVMVKVTGFGKGAAHVKSHLDYISRNGKLELENDRGEVFSGKDEIAELFDDWKQDFSDSKRRKNQRDSMHLVLSMPEGTDANAVKDAARAFTKMVFGANHEYVFALHTDEPHPHVHVTVKTLGFDGRRLRVGKDTAQDWREEFAQAMREQGVDAEATPRQSRGVVKKPVRQVIRHIERGDKTHKPRISRVRAAKVKEMADELLAEARGQPAKPRRWEAKIKATQEAIRAAWLAAAAQLDQSHSPDDKSLGARIKDFVTAMPSFDTERHEIRRMLIERFGNQRRKDQTKIRGGQAVADARTAKGDDKAAPSPSGKGMER